MNRKRIAVIGAGIAGLTAAWRIQQNGLEPIVFEAESQVGGRSCSFQDGGAIHDLGAWTFTAQSPILRLANELGLTDKLVSIPTTIGRPVNGRLRTGNLRTPVSLFGTALTPREALSAGQALLMAYTMPEKQPDEPAALWATRHFSSEFRRNLLEPLAGLYFLQELSTLSRNDFLKTMRYLSGIQLYGFRSGMGYLASSLAIRFPIRTIARVESIELAPKKVYIIGQGFEESTDGLIVATALPDTIKLLGRYLSHEVLAAALAWKYTSTLVIRLLLRRQWPKIALQVLPPNGGEWLSCGLTMEKVKHASRVPEGYELVAMYAKPERVSELSIKSDSELVELFATELECWLAISKKDIEKYWVHRWKHATAFSDVGVSERLHVLKQGFKRLRSCGPAWVAGDFLGDSGLSGAVNSAEDAAQDCLDHFKQCPISSDDT